MRGSSFGYLLKEGGRNVFSNRLMSFASVGVLMACLMLIGAAVMLSLNVTSMVGFAESQNEVVVFLEDSLGEDGIKEVEASLHSLENVNEVVFISKEQALEEQKEVWKEAGALWESMEANNNLPNSFRIKLNDLSVMAQTTATIATLEGVDEISAPVEVADVLTDLQKSVTTMGAIIIGILMVVSIVIISNTIKITVFSRRKEINIMKFCGATDMFIRLPFVVEGVLIGLISALLAFLLLWLGYDYAMGWLGENPTTWLEMALNNMVDFQTVAPQILGAFVGAGTGIGAFGSLIFIRKHLKV